jgi:PAS domain S-box-containing protein
VTGVPVPGVAREPARLVGWLRLWWPPLHRPEFWVVQGLVLGIALGHGLVETTGVLDLHGADFLPVSLYLLPVVYAALTFGMRGAAPTAIWSFVLTLPNIGLWHEGAGALGELWQASLVVGVGLFVGHWIDRERTARQAAEARERERRASEDRYRGLFDVAADPILLLDQEGLILEANAAAVHLLERPLSTLRGTKVRDFNATIWRAIQGHGGSAATPLEITRPGGRIWVEPVAVPFHDADGRPRVLAQLRDVTLAIERQQLVESFARLTLAAREEERRRVARDLHDGPLQSLMLLWRNLDAVEEPGNGTPHRAVAAARRRAEEVADELRRFSRDLRPSVLDDLGLAAALKAETSALAGRTALNCSFESVGGQRRLPMEVELTILRICQEGLRNIERHAHAKHAAVRLELEPDHYRLLVSDDGVGVAPLPPAADLVSASRLGVVGMQERARLVGATCSIGASAPWSTVVEVVGPTPSAGATTRSSTPGDEHAWREPGPVYSSERTPAR